MGSKPDRRDDRFNFWACFIDAVGWSLGFSFFSPDTILPAFVRHLTPSRQAVAFIQVALNAGLYLPPLLVSHLIERFRFVRSYVLGVALLERLPLLLMGPLAVWLWRAGRPGLLVTVTLICIACHGFFMGLNFPAYTALVEKSVPTRQRGRMYGWGNGIGGLLGIGGAWLAGQWLAHLPFPGGYARCFGVGFWILTLSILPLGLVREPPNEQTARPHRWFAYLGQLPQVLRSDRHFAQYLGAMALQALGLMGVAFYTVYALDTFQAPEKVAAQFTLMAMATRIVANPLWGHAIDHWGNRWVLVGGTLCLVLTPAAALAAPSVSFYYAVFALSALGSSAIGLASYTWIMEVAPSERVPTYISLGTTLLAPIKLAVPLFGGLLAEAAGYPAVFGLGLAASLASLPLVARLHEPRHAPFE